MSDLMSTLQCKQTTYNGTSRKQSTIQARVMLVGHFHYVLVVVIVVVISRVLHNAQPYAGCGSPVGPVTIFGR